MFKKTLKDRIEESKLKDGVRKVEAISNSDKIIFRNVVSGEFIKEKNKQVTMCKNKKDATQYTFATATKLLAQSEAIVNRLEVLSVKK